MVIVVWLVLALVAGVIASNKGRSFFGFFLLAVLLSPLIGIICALVAKSKTDLEASNVRSGIGSRTHRKCPHCAEVVLREAKVCKHCGRDIASPTQAAAT